MGGGWYRMGRGLGMKARQGVWVWKRMVGSEGEARAAEEALGRELAKELRAGRPGVLDAGAGELVARVGERLAGRLKDKRRRWHFEVFGGEEVNACALPGGWVFVSEGLVRACGGDEAEVAFAVAHEMAHVVKGHAWDRVVGSAAFSVLLRRLGAGGAMGEAARRLGGEFLERAYSREREGEADGFAVRLMEAAGYDAAGAVRLLERLGESGAAGGYFSTHPGAKERIGRVGRRL